VRFIQHKAEARWFYRVVSKGYDRWINPLFWTAPMRDAALALARLDDPANLQIVDVGAGTGFATEAIVAAAGTEHVTMLDQSPHQLARAGRKRALDGVTKVLGDAETLPFATDSRDRYVSTGSVEYWPDPQRAVAEAYRVVRPGGIALLAGPLRRTHPLARWLSDAWMLFPTEQEYVDWFARAGFERIDRVHVAPAWWQDDWDPYAVAIAAVKPRPGESSLRLDPPAATEAAGLVTPARLARFAAGSLAGAAFIPVAVWFTLVQRLRRR
jgi:MPBQ/MSBQ methyltransferase